MLIIYSYEKSSNVERRRIVSSQTILLFIVRTRLATHRQSKPFRNKWSVSKTTAWDKRIKSNALHVWLCSVSYLEIVVIYRSFTVRVADENSFSTRFSRRSHPSPPSTAIKIYMFRACVRNTYFANDGQFDGAPCIGCPMHHARSKVSCDDSTKCRHKHDANSFKTKISND